MTKNAHHQKNGRSKADLKAIQDANKPIPYLLAKYSSTLDGMTEELAERRLLDDGPNEVAREEVPSFIVQLFKTFQNPFILVLSVLAIISFITDYWIPKQAGEETDISAVVIILTMIVLSSALRFWQEFRSEKAALALRSMVTTTATVIRRANAREPGNKRDIPVSDLVVGDIIWLSAGDMLPADVRLIESKDLFISQAVLTGESIPVEKYDTLSDITAKNVADEHCEVTEDSAPLEQSSLCFMGTNVVSGTAKAIVVATGEQTYFGSLAKSIVGTRAQTAFDRGVNSVSWLLIRFMMIMVPIVFLINGFSKGDWSDAFMFALAVAVGLTPEMLPMIVSANLAKGSLAMSKEKVVVKRLNAIQNFGAMDVLCTDKTGTLTQDKIILEHHLNARGDKDDRVLYMAWVNSHFQSGVKNLIDKAVNAFSQEVFAAVKPKGYSKVDELPFDFVRRRLSVIVSDYQKEDKEHLLVCKGAVEEMLAICTSVQENGENFPLDDAKRAEIIELANRYNRDGFRVLILASKRIHENDLKEQYTIEDESDLVIEGLLTFLDPPKESAKEAIRALTEIGVTLKVLTGDNPVVTDKVCREVGLEVGTPILGPEIEQMDDDALAEAVETHTVFAKLTPLQKSRVLRALQNNGHTVGFLGDGINDAPALRDADVGISVDSATDIAKESADIILLEKSLMVLEVGVLRGRETFGNIMKYLNMTASSNFGNVFSVLVASAFIPFLPMLAIHLLIQNLLYDISQLALPWDRVDEEYLQKPRKWDAKNIGRFMIWIGPTSSIFDVTTFALMWFVFSANSVEMQALFQSGWFIEGLLSQTLVVHMLRTRRIPFIQSTAAFPVLVMTIFVSAIGIYIPFSSFGTIVGLTPLPWSYFPWLVGTLVAYCCVAQMMKMIYIRKFKMWY